MREGLPLGELLASAGSGQVRPEPQFERVVVSFPSGVEVGFTLDDGLFALWRKWMAQPVAAPDPQQAGKGVSGEP